MLQKYLKKLGINSYQDLNEEEKDSYKEWEQAISGRKLTDKDVVNWLEEELSQSVSRLTEINLSKDDEIFRKVEVRFIKKILNFLNSPMLEKQFAEKSIEQLLKK